MFIRVGFFGLMIIAFIVMVVFSVLFWIGVIVLAIGAGVLIWHLIEREHDRNSTPVLSVPRLPTKDVEYLTPEQMLERIKADRARSGR